jgi:hypothetical protein
MARFSALDRRFSQLQMVTRTETPERWLISLALRARCVSSATTCFMYSGAAVRTPSTGKAVRSASMMAISCSSRRG